MIAPSELILNQDKSIYHLKLKPEHLANKVIIAGDPGRIAKISSYFDQIDHIIENREFVTHTGWYKGTRITALATGIGTDNIDIVLNELDALINVDLENRVIKDQLTSLEIVRIGTCGSIQENILADDVIVSSHALGLDGLLQFYPYEMKGNVAHIFEEIIKQVEGEKWLNQAYLAKGSEGLIEKIGHGFHRGITITASGFYGPQGRSIRIPSKRDDQNERFRDFKFDEHQLLNYEMETSALYGLSELMGHNACTVCAVVANRYANSFSKDYNVTISKLIKTVLDRLV